MDLCTPGMGVHSWGVKYPVTFSNKEGFTPFILSNKTTTMITQAMRYARKNIRLT